MKIKERTYQKIMRTIGSFPAETGGFLAGSLKTEVVSDFYFDIKAITTENQYIPDTQALLHRVHSWEDAGLNFIGSVHSHSRLSSPSQADIRSSQALLDANPYMGYLLLGILTDKLLTLYKVTADSCEKIPVEVVP